MEEPVCLAARVSLGPGSVSVAKIKLGFFEKPHIPTTGSVARSMANTIEEMTSEGDLSHILQVQDMTEGVPEVT